MGEEECTREVVLLGTKNTQGVSERNLCLNQASALNSSLSAHRQSHRHPINWPLHPRPQGTPPPCIPIPWQTEPTTPRLTLLCLGGSCALTHPWNLSQHHPSVSPAQWPRFCFAPFPILRICAPTGFWTQATTWFWASCSPGMWIQTAVSKLMQETFLFYRLHSKCWETSSLEAPFQLPPCNTAFSSSFWELWKSGSPKHPTLDPPLHFLSLNGTLSWCFLLVRFSLTLSWKVFPFSESSGSFSEGQIYFSHTCPVPELTIFSYVRMKLVCLLKKTLVYVQRVLGCCLHKVPVGNGYQWSYYTWHLARNS